MKRSQGHQRGKQEKRRLKAEVVGSHPLSLEGLQTCKLPANSSANCKLQTGEGRGERDCGIYGKWGNSILQYRVDLIVLYR